MKLFTKPILAKLLENGAKAKGGEDNDFVPVCKLFTPQGAGTWLLTELNPDAPHIAFGLCDLGHGCPELGYVDLNELTEALKSLRRLPVERDRHWTGEHPIGVYAEAAIVAGRIIDTIPAGHK